MYSQFVRIFHSLNTVSVKNTTLQRNWKLAVHTPQRFVRDLL